MSIKPPVICACVLAAAAVTPTALYAGSSSSSSSYSDVTTESVADRAVARKEEDMRRAQAYVDAGDAAMKQRDYETAFAQYKAAAYLLTESPVTHHLRGVALDGFEDAACDLAEQRIGEGRYEDAQNLCKAVLDDKYLPDSRRANTIMAHLEDPAYYNKAITPRFRGKVEEVKRLFVEAQSLYDTGQYDKAYEDYDKILNLDPYNIAARKGQEEVDVRRTKYADEAYNMTRGDMLWQLDKEWQIPVHPYGIKGTGNLTSVTTDVRHTEYITNKLNRIIIPKIEFHDATLREALDFLKQKSRELDTEEQDPNKKGINIVLQEESGSGSSAPEAAPSAAPAAPAIPGLEAPPAGTTPGLPGAATTAAPAVSGEQRITLSQQHPADERNPVHLRSREHEDEDRSVCGGYRAALGEHGGDDHQGV